MRFIKIFLGISIAAIAFFSFPTQTQAGLPQAIAVISPDNLGINEGSLSPCPSSPNCVVSQNADSEHSISPIPYDTDLDTAKETLLKVLTVVPRTEIIEEDNNYIRAQSKSKIFGFVDDVEFYLPKDEKVIHLRSASRVGESDLGVNRRRLEQVRLALQDLGI